MNVHVGNFLGSNCERIILEVWCCGFSIVALAHNQWIEVLSNSILVVLFVELLFEEQAPLRTKTKIHFLVVLLGCLGNREISVTFAKLKLKRIRGSQI
jgi:Ca2+/Na+ antiporter